MDPMPEGRTTHTRSGLFSWVVALLAIGVGGFVLWTFAAPKDFYDSWWESQRPAGPATHEQLALYDGHVFRVRSLTTTIRGDSLYVHPNLAGSLVGSYNYRADLTIGGLDRFEIVLEQRPVVLPDERASLDFAFALSELDSAFAEEHGDSLRYQVRLRLDPGYLYDPKMRSAQAASGDRGSTAFMAATYFGRR